MENSYCNCNWVQINTESYNSLFLHCHLTRSSIHILPVPQHSLENLTLLKISWFRNVSLLSPILPRTTCYGTSSRIVFVHFLEELKTQKRYFEINRPLTSVISKLWQANNIPMPDNKIIFIEEKLYLPQPIRAFIFSLIFLWHIFYDTFNAYPKD